MPPKKAETELNSYDGIAEPVSIEAPTPAGPATTALAFAAQSLRYLLTSNMVWSADYMARDGHIPHGDRSFANLHRSVYAISLD